MPRSKGGGERVAKRNIEVARSCTRKREEEKDKFREKSYKRSLALDHFSSWAL